MPCTVRFLRPAAVRSTSTTFEDYERPLASAKAIDCTACVVVLPGGNAVQWQRRGAGVDGCGPRETVAAGRAQRVAGHIDHEGRPTAYVPDDTRLYMRRLRRIGTCAAPSSYWREWDAQIAADAFRTLRDAFRIRGIPTTLVRGRLRRSRRLPPAGGAAAPTIPPARCGDDRDSFDFNERKRPSEWKAVRSGLRGNKS
jgi:hypothetical protein